MLERIKLKNVYSIKLIKELLFLINTVLQVTTYGFKLI